jgi:hypothetical protein
MSPEERITGIRSELETIEARSRASGMMSDEDYAKVDGLNDELIGLSLKAWGVQ